MGSLGSVDREGKALDMGPYLPIRFIIKQSFHLSQKHCFQYIGI